MILFTFLWLGMTKKVIKNIKKYMLIFINQKVIKLTFQWQPFTLFHEIGHILSKLELKTTNNDYLKGGIQITTR